VEARQRTAARRGFAIRNPRDFYGGLALVALAVFALWASRDLPGSQGLAFGPGTAPRLFAGLLVLVGAIVSVIGLLGDGPARDRYTLRAPLLVTASLLVFAGTIRPIGLVLATFVSIVVAASASSETRWREAVVWAAALTAFCALLFPYALGLPLPVWPRL
jgi:putative tricarboxylic transport membrane protein